MQYILLSQALPSLHFFPLQNLFASIHASEVLSRQKNQTPTNAK